MTYLDEYPGAVLGQDTSVRDVMSKERNILGPHSPRDALSEGRNVRYFSVGHTLSRESGEEKPGAPTSQGASQLVLCLRLATT
jgi:hypothetical protein